MNIFNGLGELITSPSGIFSLISLVVLSVLTWHFPAYMGGAPWCAFFGIIPAALGYFEHKETLAQMSLSQQTPPPPPLPSCDPTAAIPPAPGATITTTTTAAPAPAIVAPTTATITIPLANLPARGVL
jgi:hypothetical protein